MKVAGAILGLLVVLAFAFAEFGPPSSGEHRTGTSDAPVRAADPIQLAQRRAYSILRGPEEAVPAYVRTDVKRALKTAGRFRIDSSHSVATPGGKIWVATGDAGGESVTCVVQAGSGAVSCLPTELATRAGLALGIDTRATSNETSPNGFLLIGIAPDWVRTVRVRMAGKPIQSLPVQRNAYSTRAGVPIVVEGYCGNSRRGCVALAKLGPRPE